MKDYYAWNVRFVISSQRDFGFIPNLVPGPAKRIGRMFSKNFCDKQMTWNHFPLLSDFKDNKTFHGLVLAWAIVSVSSPSGCFQPNFSLAGCDSYVGSKEWELLLCYRAVRHLRIEETVCPLWSQHVADTYCKITEVTKKQAIVGWYYSLTKCIQLFLSSAWFQVLEWMQTNFLIWNWQSFL